MRLGILGGAFDPIHFGHLRVAEEVYESLALERMLFIPTAVPPHKATQKMTSFDHRLKMVQLAIADIPHFAISEIEREIPGRSYSVETLRRLYAIFGSSTEFYFIMGLDAFAELPTWKEYRQLPSYAHLVAVDRPGHSEAELKAVLDEHFPAYTYDGTRGEYLLPGQYSLFHVKTTSFDISSSAIRLAVSERRSIRFLLPSAVAEYIYRERLYA